LALQNQSFALALSRVRAALRSEAERQWRAKELKAFRGQLGLSDADFMADSLMEQLANGTGDKLLKVAP
jgi:hypothetical protein